MTGSSTEGIRTVLHPVSDLATAKDLLRRSICQSERPRSFLGTKSRSSLT